MAHIRNYVGQLRFYSYVDLVLLFWALHASLRVVCGASLLWFGFLIHLEWRHRDRGRLGWHWSIWALLWLAALFVVPGYGTVAFYLCAVGYAYKKRFRWAAAVSPLLNGMLKTFLSLATPATTAGSAALVLVLMSFRNLLGDIRDAAKDAEENVMTVPVLAGYRRPTPYVYPCGLVATSLTWTLLGGLPWWAFAGALAVQAGTYHLTPR
ncbi:MULTISPECIES: hypothetical protein [unclassified Streptomyces]|uniref:Uncharacterized protein n=1 Tax=Streptomyces sp. NBC_00060 TaxID=2975636 RepID=A0AAU2H548_9ACTN